MTISIPTLNTGIPSVDKSFRIACGDFAGNIARFQNNPVIIAGIDDDSPWIRDAAFNTWYAGMLGPDIAKNTLCSVLTRTENGLFIDDGSEQYWDKIIWAWGAWKYYLYTGDSEFIKTALEAVENTLVQLIRDEFDEKDGLFRGGACFLSSCPGSGRAAAWCCREYRGPSALPDAKAACRRAPDRWFPFR